MTASAPGGIHVTVEEARVRDFVFWETRIIPVSVSITRLGKVADVQVIVKGEDLKKARLDTATLYEKLGPFVEGLRIEVV